MSFSGYDATPGSGLTFGTDLISGKHYPRVKVGHGAEGAITDVSTASPLPVGGAAADDAAAAGNPLPVAGVYQATVDEIDDGDVGRVRLSKRRAQVLVPDFHSVVMYSLSVAGYGDIEVSTTGELSGYAAPTTAFFNGTDVGFTGETRWVKIPMAVAGWRDCSMIFQNALGVNCQFTVKGMTTWDTNWLTLYSVYSATVNSAGSTGVAPYATGTGGVAWVAVPALANPFAHFIVELDPVSDPSSGFIALSIARRS